MLSKGRRGPDKVAFAPKVPLTFDFYFGIYSIAASKSTITMNKNSLVETACSLKLITVKRETQNSA